MIDDAIFSRRLDLAIVTIATLMTYTPAIASDPQTTAATSLTKPQKSRTDRQAQDSRPLTCAARYHARLGSEVLPKARATLSIASQMREPRPELPGYWLFWDGSGVLARSARQQRLLATQQINLRDNRMCVRSILARGGRIRCLQWKPIPAGYVPPKPVIPTVDPAQPGISKAERRIAAQVSSRVTRQGAFAELRYGTAFYHMAQRTSDELIAYARQPYRATICTGANEMLKFYKRRLNPLARKTSRATELREETHQAALATARIYARETDNKVSHDGNKTLSQILRRLVKSVLRPDEYATLVNNSEAQVLIQSVRDFLTDQRLSEIAKPQRGALKKALRNMEFAIYARYNSQHWQRFSKSYAMTFRAIQTAHQAECTCNE